MNTFIWIGVLILLLGWIGLMIVTLSYRLKEDESDKLQLRSLPAKKNKNPCIPDR